MIYATAAATVPKQCVVVRKAYGAGIYAMSGPAYDPEERAKREQELREEYRDDIDAHRMASEVIIDEIVPPSDLRAEPAARFELYDTVEKDRPEKKHGTIL